MRKQWKIKKYNMKSVIYARVSTNEDRQDINNQIDPLKKFADSLGYNNIKVYYDYVSGGSSNRPQFQEMLKASDNKEFDIILIWALDRFSREGILNTLSYLRRLKENGVALKSLKESWLDTSESGMGQLLLAIFSWVAEQERIRLSERIKAGLSKADRVGKRGKDKKKRDNAGYLLRYLKLRQKKDEDNGIYKIEKHYINKEQTNTPK